MTTKNVQVDVPINVMRAALMCAAKDDVREWCNAVRVERKSGKLYVISTRGTILFTHLVGQSDGADVAVTIPRTALDALRLTAKSCGILSVRIGEHYRVINGSLAVDFTLIDGHYPDWRKIVLLAQDSNNSPVQFDPELYGILADALRLANSTKSVPYARHSPDNNTLMLHHDGKHSVGVLAGYRATSDSIPSILNDLRAS